jgi:anti-sigma factor RsiW
MSCMNPIHVEVITDYSLVALKTPEQQDVKEHLFRCDECGTRLRESIALAESLRKLSGEGSLVAVVRHEFVKACQGAGLTCA